MNQRSVEAKIIRDLRIRIDKQPLTQTELIENFKLMGYGVAVFVLSALLILGCNQEAHAGDLSPHFNRSEFNQHREPLPVDQIKVSAELVEKLEKLRHAIGDKPINIRSGYRSPAYNKSVGGAKHSQHMEGRAVDIVVDGMTAKQLEPIAKSVGFTFTQTYKHLPHLHVDVR